MTSPDEGPEWADEAHLDEVFSTWVPGPPDSASAAEKEMAGDNPRLELPAEDEISDEDMDAALAAALAEAELLTANSADAEVPELAVMAETEAEFEADPQPQPQRAERSEPAGPSWLNITEPEAAPSPATPATVNPEPVFEPSPDQVVDVATSEAALGSGQDAAFVDGEPEPASAFEPEPAQAGMPAFDPPPPPVPAGPSRPWTRSDDDILPGRKGKGRRR